MSNVKGAGKSGRTNATLTYEMKRLVEKWMEAKGKDECSKMTYEQIGKLATDALGFSVSSYTVESLYLILYGQRYSSKKRTCNGYCIYEDRPASMQNELDRLRKELGI